MRQRAAPNVLAGLLLQERGGTDGDFEFFITRRSKEARPVTVSLFAHRQVVHLEVEEMAQPVAYVTAAVFESHYPFIIGELVVELDVGTAQSDFVVVDAGEVCFATNAAGKAAVERVIPGAEFPDDRRVDGGNEIADIMRDIDDILVGADTVEARHFEGWQGFTGNLQPPSAVREADNATLVLPPFQDG